MSQGAAQTTVEQAPFEVGALDQALLPFGEGTMLPAEAYTSPKVLAWERRHFFAASWVCLGRVEAVFPEGRTQVGGDVGRASVREAALRHLIARRPQDLVPTDLDLASRHDWTLSRQHTTDSGDR